MDFSSIFETIKGFFEANVLPTLKPIIDAIMGLIRCWCYRGNESF